MRSWAGPRKFVIDARAVTTRSVPDVFAKAAAAVRENSELQRVVFLASPHDASRRVDTRVGARCVEGLVRSLAKEVGRKGATVNMVLAKDAWTTNELVLPLGLLMDDERFAFMSGQVVSLVDEPSPAVKAAGLFVGDESGCSEDESAAGRAVDAGWGGKTVAVTGASGGIGRAVSQWCRERGARVLEMDLPALQDPAAQVPQLQHVPVDLMCEGSVRAAAADIASRVGTLDGIVHCAGITRDRTLAKMPAEDWTASLDVNLFRPMQLTDLLLKSKTLVPKQSVVVSTSSVIGFAGNFGQTHYAAGKMAMRTWVEELAARKGMRAYGIAPGYIETPMTAAMPPEILKSSIGHCALNRMGRPSEIAHVVGALLSRAGGVFAAGQTLRVCGGHFMGA